MLKSNLFRSRYIDDQRICNLIGGEHILVSNLKAYVIHEDKALPKIDTDDKKMLLSNWKRAHFREFEKNWLHTYTHTVQRHIL